MPEYIKNLSGAIETIAQYENIDVAITRCAQSLTRAAARKNNPNAYSDVCLCEITPDEYYVAEATDAFVTGYTKNNPDLENIYILSVDADGTKHVDYDILKNHWETSGRAEGRKIRFDDRNYI